MSAAHTQSRRERRQAQRERAKAQAAPRTPTPSPATPSDGRVNILVNAVLFGMVLLFGWLYAFHPEVYHRSVQEDEALEWATFWAFAGATVVFSIAAVRDVRHGGRLPWYSAGLGLFCVVVALEEISWGQRLLGYQAPEYFLAHNFQQEFTVHNVVSTQLRAFALKAIIVGYGVALPLLAQFEGMRAMCTRLGIVPPPMSLVPSFGAMFVLRQVYPWSYTGEVVECMLGVGFLCAAFMQAPIVQRDASTIARPAFGQIAGTLILVALLGGATASGVQWLRPVDENLLATAEREVKRLGRDFRRGSVHRPAALYERNVEKRVYSYRQKYQVDALDRGAFARLTRRGLPAMRAQYFLDPWNMPYWISSIQSVEENKEFIFVYSFGPNRRRDSSRWQIQGDDIGWVVQEKDGEVADPASPSD